MTIKLKLPFDSDLLDTSGFANHFTQLIGPAITFGPGHGNIGNAATFALSGAQYPNVFTAPLDADFDIGTGPFYVEGWINCAAPLAPDDRRAIFHLYKGDSASDVYVSVNGFGEIELSMIQNSNNRAGAYSSLVVADSTDRHIMVGRNAAGLKKIFVNGVDVTLNSGLADVSNLISFTHRAYLGVYANGSSFLYNGKLNMFRFSPNEEPTSSAALHYYAAGLGTTTDFGGADVTAPAWTATYPKAGAITNTSIEALLQVDEAGTGYVVVVPNGDIPSVAQIKAGQRSNGTPAIAANSGALVALTNLSLPLTGLSPHTEYDLWAVATDTAGNNTAAKAFSQSDDQTINSLLAGVSIVSSVVLTNDTGTTAAKENLPFNLDVTFSDADGTADISTIELFGAPPAGWVIAPGAYSAPSGTTRARAFTVTPGITSAAAGFQLIFRATDLDADIEDIATITFAVGNTAPVADNEPNAQITENTVNTAFATLSGTDANSQTLLKRIDRLVFDPLGVATPITVGVASVSGANPAVVTTGAAHGRLTGDKPLIAGTTTTPSINGSNRITVISPTSFSVPVDTTGAGQIGAAGTVESIPTWITKDEITGILDASPPLATAGLYRIFYKVKDGAY